MHHLLAYLPFSLDFFTSLLSIITIDLVLAGDNAVVIALAVRNLPSKTRLRGIIFGAGAAVALRVALTFFAAKLLDLVGMKKAGRPLGRPRRNLEWFHERFRYPRLCRELSERVFSGL